MINCNCGRIYPTYEGYFNKSSYTPSGYATTCKICKQKYNETFKYKSLITLKLQL